MLKKRIIPLLLLRNGRMVKGLHFQDYRDTGDPVSAARIYNHQYADELMFFDIDATEKQRPADIAIIEEVARECFMPLTIGGGITSVEQVHRLLNGGADKVVVNTAAYGNASLIQQIAQRFGQQCITVGIDVKKHGDLWQVYSHNGTHLEPTTLEQHIKEMDSQGTGEFLLQSIDQDGSRQGYDLDLLKTVVALTNKPVVISGGAGHFMHLVEAFEHGAHGVGCASIFHFADNNPLRVRSYLKNKGIEVKRYK